MTVEVKNVYKAFGEKKVLVGFNAVFGEGTNIVTGPSGCGKTTLLRIVAGLEKPDSGEVLFDGSAVKAAVSFVFSEPRLFPNCTALDNAAAVSKTGIKRGREKAAEFLGALGMAGALRLFPCELSAGMAQRVQLARALISVGEGTEVLLLDEPFRGLDPETKGKAASFIIEKSAGKTVICVTHERDDIPLLNAVSELSFGNDTTV